MTTHPCDRVRRQHARGAWLAVTCALAFTLPAWGQDAKPATTTLERKAVAADAERDASPYKTRAGRRAAKPLDWNSTLGKRAPAAAAPEAEAHAAKAPSSAKGGAPDPGARREAQRLHPDDWPHLVAAPKASRTHLPYFSDGARLLRTAGSPDVFTQYTEGPPSNDSAAPQDAIGKLFLNGGFCSASVVSGNNVIVTAAHCCYDRGANKWTGGWVFAPGENNGNAPFGTFDWSTATVLNSWISNGDIPSDVCLIKLQNDAHGHGVSWYVGWLGRAWDWPSDQELHAAGYPGNIGGGNVLELCTAETFSPSGSCGGSGVLNMGCSMTFGSSGGPWIRHYRSDNWVNAVVHGYDSTSCTGTFGQTFNGPRFTSSNIVTLCNAAGC